MDAMLSNIPPQVLQQALLGQIPDIKPFSALAELDRRNKAAKMQQGIAAQGAMQAPTPPTVIQQVLAQSGGLHGMGAASSYAGGGIVAFASGGSPDSGIIDSSKYYDESDQKELQSLNDSISSLDKDAIDREQRRKNDINSRQAERDPIYEAQRAEIQRRRALAEQMKAELLQRRQASMQERQFDPTGADSLAAMAQASLGQRRLGGALAAMAGGLSNAKRANMLDVEALQDKAATQDAAMAAAEDARRDLENAISERAYAARTGDQDAIAAAEEKIAAARQKLLVTQKDSVRAAMQDKYNMRRAAAQDEANRIKEMHEQAYREKALGGQQSANQHAKLLGVASIRMKMLEAYSNSPEMLILATRDPVKKEALMATKAKKLFAGLPPEYWPPDYVDDNSGGNGKVGNITDKVPDFSGFSARQIK